MVDTVIYTKVSIIPLKMDRRGREKWAQAERKRERERKKRSKGAREREREKLNENGH